MKQLTDASRAELVYDAKTANAISYEATGGRNDPGEAEMAAAIFTEIRLARRLDRLQPGTFEDKPEK